MNRKPRIAFVATGGAAKGLAHLGVLRAAEELGIAFDMFVGSSAGAIVGASCGQGIALDRLIDSFRPAWRRRYGGPYLVGRTFAGLPRPWQIGSPGHLASGIFSIDPFERWLRDFLPNNDFRKLARPVWVVATDLDSCARVVFGPGHIEHVEISRAVAASCCVPLLFRPYAIEGSYYMDGETMRTFSADIAIDHGADVVVISNVYSPHRTEPGRRSIAHRGVRAVLTQTFNLVLHEKAARGIDLYRRIYPNAEFLVIEPDIGHLGFLNRFRARAFVRRGYREALRMLSAAQARGVFDRKKHLHAIAGE